MSLKRTLGTGLKLAVSLTLMAWLYRRVDLTGIGSVIAGTHLGLLLVVFALLFFNTAISTLKWQILLKADDVVLPFNNLLASYMVGTFFNVFLPSNIGGDAYRIYDVARQSAKPVHTFASVFVDRLSGFCALAIMGFIFPLSSLGLLSGRRVLLLPLLVFAAIVLLIWGLYQQRLVRWGLRVTRLDRIAVISRSLDQFLGSITTYKEKPGVLTRIMGVSFCFQFTVIICVYVLSRAVGIQIPFVFFCAFVPLISLLEALPISIFGLGLRDAGYVFFFTQVGHTREGGLAMALLYVAVSLVYAAVGGLVFAFKRKT